MMSTSLSKKRKHDSDNEHVCADVAEGGDASQSCIVSYSVEDSWLMDAAILYRAAWTSDEEETSRSDIGSTSSPRIMDSIPDMLLLETFKHVGILDIQNPIARVCRRWRHLCESRALLTTIFIDTAMLPVLRPSMRSLQYSEICKAWDDFLTEETARLCVKIPLRLTNPALAYGSSNDRVVLPLLRLRNKQLCFSMLWDFRVSPNAETFWKTDSMTEMQAVFGEKDMAFDHLACLTGHRVLVKMKSGEMVFANLRMKVSGDDLFLLYTVPGTAEEAV